MRLEIMGIPFDNVTMDEALDAAMRLLSQPGASDGVTPNSEIVYGTFTMTAAGDDLPGGSDFARRSRCGAGSQNSGNAPERKGGGH